MIQLKMVGLFVFFWMINFQLLAQTDSLYKLEARLMHGDKSALYEIAPFFDSRKKVVEFLGHHLLEPLEASIARRIVQENTLFTDDEFKIADSATATGFMKFLRLNNEKIIFSKLADAFLITPVEERKTDFEIRKITDKKLADLREHTKNLSELNWVWENKIDSLIKE